MPPRGKEGTKEKGGPKEKGPDKPSGPSARPPLSREYIAHYKQRRIMDALAELTAEQGYEATKISDIVRRAGVARKTLYDNFEGKEEVFLAAFDEARDEVMRRVEESDSALDGNWEERIEAGLAVVLGYIAEQPTLARMCVIEALYATPTTIKRHDDAFETFVELTKKTLPRDERLPGTTAETLVGGVDRIIHQLIRRGEAERAEDLLPELTEFMVGPFAGAGLSDPVAGGADEKG